jgi:hypothetical protein
MGTFVPRLVALTLVWLFATAALTYAAARKIAAPTKAAATTTAVAPAPARTLVVPDVRTQPYVFAEGTLGDAGFGWRVEGAVQGYAANTVATQTPAAGTRVVDTGNPLVVLRLSHPNGAKQIGEPQQSSPLAGTAVKLADLAGAAAPAPAQATPPAKKTAPAKKTPAKRTVETAKNAAPQKVATKKTPAHRWPQHRPAAFAVTGARPEPLDEMPLTDRADMLLRYIEGRPKPTDANVRYWLYQHAWIVAGARMGWWHGSAALKTLVTVDERVWTLWGIGARSEQLARQTLAEVEARTS